MAEMYRAVAQAQARGLQRNRRRTRLTQRKSVSVFRIRDATGTERIYHSLEEMPPEVRALVEKARDQGKA